MCNRMTEDAPNVERIPLIKRRFLRLHGVIDIRDFLSGWFHGAPFEVPVVFQEATQIHLIHAFIHSHFCFIVWHRSEGQFAGV